VTREQRPRVETETEVPWEAAAQVRICRLKERDQQGLVLTEPRTRMAGAGELICFAHPQIL
jgi:hypothetical protein